MEPASLAIIFDETKTQLLLVLRQDVPIWVLPGGGIDLGETPWQAAIREVKEETGYTVTIERQSGDYFPINRLAAPTSVFICRIIAGEATPSLETPSIAFFKLKELPKSLFEPHKAWLQDALTHPHCVKKPITQVTYAKLLFYFLKHPLIFFKYLWTRLTH